MVHEQTYIGLDCKVSVVGLVDEGAPDLQQLWVQVPSGISLLEGERDFNFLNTGTA